MIGEIRVIDGSTFMLSDLNGDVDASTTSPLGLIALDTRFLSKWTLTVNGERLQMLSVNHLQYFDVRIVSVPQRSAQFIDTDLSVIRRRQLCGAFEEQVTVINHSDDPLEVRLRLEVDADFADLSESRTVLPKKRECLRRVDERSLRISHQRGAYHRITTVTSSAPAEIDQDGFTFTVHVPANEEWSTQLTVVPQACAIDGSDIRPVLHGPGLPEFQKRLDLRRWVENAPLVHSVPEALSRTYQRSLVDIAALRFQPLLLGGDYALAAGLPWYMAALGRDSILTSLQALPFVPSIAASTLRVLGLAQGTGFDDFREEDPGRIMHEFRFGETAAFEERPHSPYYGSVDATPLYVVLMD
ncbi:MAG TPA: glycogen debranching N-terminal domain-containing protein, partial [Jiangellales bacterium]|nr:glycogen debranching N-terminal domain-containing protein [Jiangellales bacterium]